MEGAATTVVLDSNMGDEVVGKVCADLGSPSLVRMYVPLGKLTNGGGSIADEVIQHAIGNGSTRLVVVAFLSAKLNQLLLNREYELEDRSAQVQRFVQSKVPAGTLLEVSVLTIPDPAYEWEDTS
jgi:hypothetical protein